MAVDELISLVLFIKIIYRPRNSSKTILMQNLNKISFLKLQYTQVNLQKVSLETIPLFSCKFYVASSPRYFLIPSALLSPF